MIELSVYSSQFYPVSIIYSHKLRKKSYKHRCPSQSLLMDIYIVFEYNAGIIIMHLH